uniref:Gnk2-homologous domain-containing protein n=1 Tax=Fagus sylvatica TaxID=28930 RepID=A0A2N9G047_FAGSY
MVMESSRILLFFFYSILIHFVKPTIAQRDPYVQHDCYTTGNVTSNSTYRANLNNLLSSLSSKTQMVNGFYNFSAGENSDKVNAIALCRADLTSTDCRSCVNMSAHELLQLCPNQKEGIMWYENCTVRYSDRFIFGSMESEPMQALLISTTSTSDRILYNDPLRSFFNSLRKEASGLFGKFANATFKVQNSFNIQDLTVYALMQCTPDLTQRDCDDCLASSSRCYYNLL